MVKVYERLQLWQCKGFSTQLNLGKRGTKISFKKPEALPNVGLFSTKISFAKTQALPNVGFFSTLCDVSPCITV